MKPEFPAAGHSTRSGALPSVVASSRQGVVVLALTLVGLLLFVASESARYGDSVVYAADILGGRLMEPGHLIWRPVGYVVAHLTGARPSLSSVLWRLQFLCLAASALSVIAIYRIASRLCDRSSAFLAALLMAVSNGFWDYSFSGCSYSASVLFGTVALGFAVADRDGAIKPRDTLWAGAFAGLSAATWAIQVLAAPAVWLALVLTPSRAKTSYRAHLLSTLRFAAGFAATFAVPLVLAYAARRGGIPDPRPGAPSVPIGAWLSSSGHGIPVHLGIAQALRAALGWPQSVLSIADLGQALRLWHLHEAAFPASPWIGSLLAFYAATAGAAWVLATAYRRLDARDRGVIVACTAALAINLAFAALWQGTDLERYFPSWPYQLLLACSAVNLLARRGSRAHVLVSGALVVTMVAAVNWRGTFAPVLGPHSYRAAWVEQLRRNTSARDLVVVFGDDPSVIEVPHVSDMPGIENVSTEIVMHGAEWRTFALRDIAKAQLRGGRVYLADSLFGTSPAPRDGWSFKEFPSPSPAELQSVFLPFKSDRVGFVVRGEKVWLGKNPAPTRPLQVN